MIRVLVRSLCAHRDALITRGSVNGQRAMSSAVAPTETTTSKEKPQEAEVQKVKEAVRLPPAHANNHPGLMAFFDEPSNWGETEIPTGREWKIEELRIKGNSDLHKLWFVLLKERNMLMTMKEVSDEECELFPSPERLDKVEQSMINLEKVVRERNKAYWELEVGPGQTGERQAIYRRDMFGMHRLVGASEHLIPYWMNTKWRKLYGPGHGPEVFDFIMRLREKKAKQVGFQLYWQYREVRQILRRFPDTDLEYLQEKYPRVPVKHLQDNLHKYKDRNTITRM